MLSLKPDHKAIVSQLSIKRLKTGNLWGFYRRELGVLRATRLIDNATEVGNRSSFFYEHHWTKKMFDLFIMWCHCFAKSFYWSHLFLSFLLHVLQNEGWTFHPQSQNFPSGDSANVWWDLSSWCLGIHKYQLASFKDPRDTSRKYSKMSIWTELFWTFWSKGQRWQHLQISSDIRSSNCTLRRWFLIFYNTVTKPFFTLRLGVWSQHLCDPDGHLNNRNCWRFTNQLGPVWSLRKQAIVICCASWGARNCQGEKDGSQTCDKEFRKVFKWWFSLVKRY